MKKVKLTLNEFFQLMHDAYGNESVLPICHAVASVYREHIFKEVGVMPILFIQGAQCTGKTSLMRIITSTFNHYQPEVSLANLSVKEIMRLLVQDDNGCLWLDEYKNLNHTTRSLLACAYEGETSDSALAIISSILPANNVLYHRSILVQMNEPQKSDKQRAAFTHICEMSNSYLQRVLDELLDYDFLIEHDFKERYSTVFDLLADLLPGVETNYIINMSCILAPILTLMAHDKIKNHGDIIEFAAENIKNQLKNEPK